MLAATFRLPERESRIGMTKSRHCWFGLACPLPPQTAASLDHHATVTGAPLRLNRGV
jgi:hypothetical protein